MLSVEWPMERRWTLGLGHWTFDILLDIGRSAATFRTNVRESMPHAPYDARLDALLRVAAQVFARKGYHATTMRDLSRASGMSLAGMYHYVPGKEDLLYLIQRRCFQSVLHDVQ